jgi:hypothetical protein
VPDEAGLRGAAEWLGALYGRIPARYLGQLADKSALVLRMARRHVPQLADELEGPDSPLSAIEEAARFMPPPLVESPTLAALRKTIAELDLPSETPIGADAAWHDNRRRLQQLILEDNPHRFLTWPVIVNSMFMSDEAVAAAEMAALEARADYAARWLPALHEDALGAPARTAVLEGASTNLIHHAYNLLQFERHTGTTVSQLSTILEFGGGYGSTARLARRLGFRGTYLIYDLPEFSALQRFYLGSLGFPIVEAARRGPGVHCVTSIDALESVLPDSGLDLFLATWSLSETPVAIRAAFVPFLRAARQRLIAYQESFGGVDNVAYFARLQLGGSDYAIGHLPGNRYLVA